MAKPLTIEQAKNLRYGQEVYALHELNADGTAQRWRVSGNVRTWKRDPSRFEVPVKHGLYDYGTLTRSNIHLFSLTEPPKVKKADIKGSGYRGYHR